MQSAIRYMVILKGISTLVVVLPMYRPTQYMLMTLRKRLYTLEVYQYHHHAKLLYSLKAI